MKSVLRVFTPFLIGTTAACAPVVRPAAGPEPRPGGTGVEAPQHAHGHHAHGGSHARASAASRPKAPRRTTANRTGAGTGAALEAFARAPLAFEQVDDQPGVYVTRTPTYLARVTPTWADIAPLGATAANTATPEPPTLRMRLLDANPAPTPVAPTALPGTINYVVGNDPTQWRTGVATYGRVRYDAVYPGIDVEYYGTQREIEYDFLVAPGASPARIALGFDGVDALALRENGDLALTRSLPHGGEAIVLRAPRASQTIDGRQVTVEARYRLSDEDPQSGRVTLDIGDYDRTKPLVIDPVLSYAMSLGGTSQDEGNAIAVDAAGNVYVAGFTRSANFPAAGTPSGHFDLFLTKLNPTGTVLLSSSYIGGSAADETRGLAIDADGNAYLAGVTRSPNFPTHNALQAALNGEADAFVLKIATNGGSVLFSTYLGGSGLDEGAGVAIDGARNVYVTGTTRSTDFPTASPRQATSGGQVDSFVTKLTSNGGSLSYSSYLGGSGSDNAHGLAADPAGNVTVVGTTNSTDFPVANAFSGTLAGQFDAFVTRLTPSGALAFSTYFGGSDIDAAQGVTLGSSGQPYLTGSTASPDFPLANATQATPGGALDAFVAGFGAGGGAPFFSTFLGGNGSDRGRAITLDPSNRLFVVGQTFSSNFPAVQPVQPTIGGNRDTFVAMFNPPYTAVTYATFLGGSNNDDGLGVAADSLGRAYVTGATMYAWPDLAGASDAFVMRLSSAAGATVDVDMDGLPDDWETQYANDLDDLVPYEDPDGDGTTNAQEYQLGTHPLGFFTRYLAEGATGAFFDTQLALFNPHDRTALVLLRFQREGQSELTRFVSLQPHKRQTINVESLPGLEEGAFATVAEADSDIVLDRTMTWDNTAFGSHAETGASELSKTWYLAEGATHGRFDLYYLLQNPNQVDASVQITYLRPDGAAPVVQHYTVPARGRLTINVDTIETAPRVRPLAETDVSAAILSTQPILAERAMYQTVGGRLFSAGHESMGVTAPARTWFFAEGATGAYFDMYLLLANPGGDPASVTIDYLFAGGGTLTRTVDVAPQSRKTLSIDYEDPQLFDAALSMKVRSTVPIIAERAMWWPSPNWFESHNSAGALVTSSRWAVAEGEVGGTRNIDTYVLIANTSAETASVRVSVFLEDNQILEPRVFTLAGNSRFNVDLRSDFPATEGSKFSVLVEGLGATPPELVVERAMYNTSNRVVWAAGTNALGTPLFPDATFLITPGGIFPKRVVVPEGTRVRFINRGDVRREMSSDPHPTHEFCPSINDIGPLNPGQSSQTGNMVIEPGFISCGFHDHTDPSNESVMGRIIMRP